MNGLRKQLLLCLFVSSVQGFAMDLTLSEDEGFDYLIANDAITSEKDVKQFRKIMESQVKKGAPTSILLTSPGGALELAVQIADIIVEQSQALFAKTERYNLIIINEECSSACAILMAKVTNAHNPQALRIYVMAHAKFGFHAPQEFKKGKVRPIKDNERRKTQVQTQVDALLAAGASPEWLAAHRDLFEKDEMTDIEAAALCSLKAGIIPADSCLADVEEDVTVITERQILRDGRPPIDDSKIPVASPTFD